MAGIFFGLLAVVVVGLLVTGARVLNRPDPLESWREHDVVVIRRSPPPQ